MPKHIGLIGCGHWGKYVLRDLLALGVDVSVIAPSLKTREFAIQQGAYAAYSDVTMLAEQVDGFVVTTPIVTHAHVIEQILRFEKPIFIEKPLTSDISFARKLAASPGKKNIFTMDKWRYHPGVDKIAKMSRANELGAIQLIRSYRLGWGVSQNDVDAFWTLFPHDLAMILHILGTLPSLFSVVPLVESNRTAGAVVTLQNDDRMKVIMEMSTLQPVKRRSISVVGSKACVELSGAYDDHLIVYEGAPGSLGMIPKEIKIDTAMPLYLELKAFVNYLHDGPPPLSPLEEGVMIVEMVHSIRKHINLDP